jgi:hypothetical protein
MVMASLTEYYLTNNDSNNDSNNNSNNDSNNSKKDWFNTVYLCIEKTKNKQINSGFTCYKFNSFENADKYYNKINLTLNSEIKTTMVPICKWIPFVIHQSVINFKLKKLYWKNDITIMRTKPF